MTPPAPGWPSPRCRRILAVSLVVLVAVDLLHGYPVGLAFGFFTRFFRSSMATAILPRTSGSDVPAARSVLPIAGRATASGAREMPVA